MNNVNYISFDEILKLKITPEECVEWATFVIKNKNNCVLHAKDSIHFGNECFFNTMPSFIPEENLFGVKVVSRILEREPTLQADIMLYDSKSGNLLCFMDGTWITTMRTGAIAAITAKTLEVKNNNEYSFMGLGNTARATLLCLDAIFEHKEMIVKILKYKNQHELFIERFKDFKNIKFQVYENVDELIKDSKVIISCVTAATSLFSDVKNYQKGVLVIPVQTRGFQNCDLEFDNIFCDDVSHISNFKNFNFYKNVTEMTDVLNFGGRKSVDERLIAYNIGISLQDVYFASKIYKKLNITSENKINNLLTKFWV